MSKANPILLWGVVLWLGLAAASSGARRFNHALMPEAPGPMEWKYVPTRDETEITLASKKKLFLEGRYKSDETLDPAPVWRDGGIVYDEARNRALFVLQERDNETPAGSLRLDRGVTDADLVHLEELPDLRELHLEMTRVTNAGLAHLDKLSKLQTLELVGRRQELTTKGLVHLKHLKDLRSLTLTYLINDGGLAYLKNFPQLRSLSLAYMDVSDEDLRHVSGLSELETLSLYADSRVTDAGMRYLGGLRHLRVCVLGCSPGHRNQITDAGLSYLAGLRKLETLSVSQTLITDAGLTQLNKLTSLKRLGLSGSQVTDQGLAHLGARKTLQEVVLYGTRVTENGAASLQRALPNAKICYGPYPRP
jgi:hypothetical protein